MLGYVRRNVACDEIGLVDVVRALYLLVAEAQMADGNAAGLLRVVLEVCLNVLVGVVADDLDGVLVRADGAVAAKTPRTCTRRCPPPQWEGAATSGAERLVTSSTMPMVN